MHCDLGLLITAGNPFRNQCLRLYANTTKSLLLNQPKFPVVILSMTLRCIDFHYKSVAIPTEIIEFLRSTNALVELHRISGGMSIRGFVPSDYTAIYQCLKVVYDTQLHTGSRFCEWGSGVGVVASLAAMIGFESFGIEYDNNLCTVAEGIREKFAVPFEVVNGSFIPAGVEDLIDDAFAAQNGELALHTDPDLAYEEMGYAINDFNLIFAYPWPNDVELTCEIFDRCAAQGALLLAYYECGSIALYRKN